MLRGIRFNTISNNNNNNDKNSSGATKNKKNDFILLSDNLSLFFPYKVRSAPDINLTTVILMPRATYIYVIKRTNCTH